MPRLPPTARDATRLTLVVRWGFVLGLAGVVGASACATTSIRTVPDTPETERIWLEERGFFLRADDALLHLDRAAIETLDVDHVAELLRRSPRLEVREWSAGAHEIFLHPDPAGERPDAPLCRPDFRLNGLATEGAGDARRLSLDALMAPEQLSGLEVYEGDGAPVGSPEACGVILFWWYAERHLAETDFLGELGGRISQIPCGVPVTGVAVALEPGPHRTLTDDHGRFHFPGIAAARYLMRAEPAEGVEWVSHHWIRAGATVEVSIELEVESCDTLTDFAPLAAGHPSPSPSASR